MPVGNVPVEAKEITEPLVGAAATVHNEEATVNATACVCAGVVAKL